MNILQIQDDLKNFSEQQLINEMQMPSGNAPQYLVLSEINRRKRVKSEYQANQAADTNTVAEEAVASAGVPMSGIAGMAEAMAPKSESSLVAPQTPPMPMREGGEVDYYANGGLIEGIAESVSSNADSLKALQGVSLQNAKLLQDMQNAGNPQATAPTPVPVQQPTPTPITPRPITPSFPSFPPSPFPTPSRPTPYPFRPQIGRGGKGYSDSRRNMLGTNMLTGLGSIAGQIQPQAMAEGGVVNARTGLSIADRNYNPGNMRLTDDPYFGTTGKASGYATFASPEYGLRGIALTADEYAKDPKVKTLKDFVEKYAPKKDNNKNNKQYAQLLADSLGVGVDDEIDFSDDNVQRRLIPAITRFEGYKGPINEDIVNRAIAASGEKKDRTKVDELLSGIDSFEQNPVNYGKDTGKANFMSAMASGNVNTGNNKIDIGLQEALRKNEIDSEFGFGNAFDTTTVPKKKNKRGGGAGSASLFDMFKSPIKQDGPTGQMKRGDPNLFGLDQKKKATGDPPEIAKFKEQQGRKVSMSELKKRFPFYYETEDAYSEGTFDVPTDDKKLGEEAKKFFDDRGVVQKEPEAKDPKSSGDKSGALTLDEQLASMQEDLKKSRNQDKWLAIAQAGLSIMASDKPTLGGAIGEGASVGLQAYRDAQERYNEGVIDVLNARAKLKGKSSAFGMKDILTRVTAIDNSIAKEREALSKILDPKSDDAKAIRAKISKLTNLRDSLSVMAGFEPFSVSSEDRKKTIAGS